MKNTHKRGGMYFVMCAICSDMQYGPYTAKRKARSRGLDHNRSSHPAIHKARSPRAAYLMYSILTETRDPVTS